MCVAFNTFDNSGSQPICMIIAFIHVKGPHYYLLAYLIVMLLFMLKSWIFLCHPSLITDIEFHPNVHIIHQNPQLLVQVETKYHWNSDEMKAGNRNWNRKKKKMGVEKLWDDLFLKYITLLCLRTKKLRSSVRAIS